MTRRRYHCPAWGDEKNMIRDRSGGKHYWVYFSLSILAPHPIFHAVTRNREWVHDWVTLEDGSQWQRVDVLVYCGKRLHHPVQIPLQHALKVGRPCQSCFNDVREEKPTVRCQICFGLVDVFSLPGSPVVIVSRKRVEHLGLDNRRTACGKDASGWEWPL